MADSAQPSVAKPTKSDFSLRLVWTRIVIAGALVSGYIVGVEIHSEMMRKAEPPPLTPARKAAIHEKLQALTAREVAQLPKRVDDITTLADLRVQGATVVYIYTVSGLEMIETEELEGLKAAARKKLCEGPSRAAILAGTSFAYEYRSSAGDRKLLGRIQIETCPFDL